MKTGKNEFKGIILFLNRVCTIFICVFVIIAATAADITHAENENSGGIIEDNEPELKTLTINSLAAILINADTGEILINKDVDGIYYPASITKVMTALLVMEHYDDFEERLVFSSGAIDSLPWDSSGIDMIEGESLSIDEAMYGLMLASANEVANAFAEDIAKARRRAGVTGIGAETSSEELSETPSDMLAELSLELPVEISPDTILEDVDFDDLIKDFAALMTERAKELGAINTSFENPHGLYGEEHYTTARDMALIMREAVKYPQFVKYISTASRELPATEKHGQRKLTNSNKMIIESSDFYYADVIGGKTGYIDESRHTLVSYAERGNVRLITVILHGEKNEPYMDTQALLEYGFWIYGEGDMF